MDRSAPHARPAVRHPLWWVSVTACALALMGALAWFDGVEAAPLSVPGTDAAHPLAPSREVVESVPFL